MKILVLGGSIFLGRAIAEAALRRGHQVTTFSRGVSDPTPILGATHIRGDRSKDLATLGAIECDLVFDTSGYELDAVQAALDVIGHSTGHYTFFSTASVYADPSCSGNDESSPLLEPYTAGGAKDNAMHFARAKLACEFEIGRRLPNKNLVIRCGLLIGCKDRTKRFTYWVQRIRHGGRVLAPDGRSQAIQYLDVEDLAEWALTMAEEKQTGVFNAIGPEAPATLGELLDTCVQTINRNAEMIWIPETALGAMGIRPFVDLPLWIPTSETGLAGLFRINGTKAFAHGLRCRPLPSTIRTLLAREPLETFEHGWLSPARETALIGAWRNAPAEWLGCSGGAS